MAEECPLQERGRQLFPWKNRLPPKEDPCGTYWRDPFQISEAQESIQRRGIAKTTSAYHLGSCHRTTPGSSCLPTRMTPPPHSKRNCRGAEVRSRTPKERDNPRIMEPLRCKFLLCQKERREALTRPRLSSSK